MANTAMIIVRSMHVADYPSLTPRKMGGVLSKGEGERWLWNIFIVVDIVQSSKYPPPFPKEGQRKVQGGGGLPKQSRKSRKPNWNFWRGWLGRVGGWGCQPKKPFISVGVMDSLWNHTLLLVWCM